MSQFLAPYFDSIPLGYTITQMQNVFVGNLTANGWQLLTQVDGLGGYSDVIPPSSETIGTSKFREVVRIYFPDNTTVSIGSYQVCIADAFAQSVRITAKTGGSVAAAVTIDGATVTGAMGSSGSTANDNLQALFYALKDSANGTIMGWDYWYNGTDTIICTNKTKTTMKTCSGNANVNYYAHGASVLSGARSGFVNVDTTYAYSVTVDLTNGFVYYMDVFSRTFKLSTKCLSGKYGPIFASYVDHDEAMASLPDSGFCTPIELMVGGIGEATVRVTHAWTVGTAYGNKTITSSQTAVGIGSYDNTPDWHPFTGAGIPQTPIDAGLCYSNQFGGSIYGDTHPLYEFGFSSTGTYFDTAYKVIPMGAPVVAANMGRQVSVRFTPRRPLPDVFRWNGTEPDETCAMATLVSPPGLNGVGITLGAALDATTSYTSILLSTTTGLPSAGGVTIGLEEFAYTGTSGGNTITGVTRAQNGTTAARHFIGDNVQPVVWFMKINQGAICAGSTKPS